MAIQITVPARPLWVDLRLDVKADDRLAFTAQGEWTDWKIRCTAKGYSRWYLAPFSPFKRVKHAPYFALIGALNKDLSTAFVIGERAQHSFVSAGRLYVFANDVKWAYGNNSGQIEVTVERV